MDRRYAVVSGLLFGVIAVGQLVRALNQWPVHIADFEVPVWASWIAVAVAGSLSAWAFRSTRR